MSHLDPLRIEELSPEMSDFLRRAEEGMGFQPNDLFIMARLPNLVKAASELVAAVFSNRGEVSLELKKLVALVCSDSAGCMYCRAHNAHGAYRSGVSMEKIEAIWDYETSNLFSEAERAALRLAQGGGQAPVKVSNSNFEDLKKYYSSDQIAELVAVIALFGFLNRWNAIMATDLEALPLKFAKEHLPVATA